MVRARVSGVLGIEVSRKLWANEVTEDPRWIGPEKIGELTDWLGGNTLGMVLLDAEEGVPGLGGGG